ncbi:MAG: PDZ domain-containing protein [Planctomycetia bacterium]|nr:MAG: PDZ domain-containing protein [Planctomycetia bacterium]RIK69476.1 MAG: peptidase S41 [Planctomycetota bacterium]
MHRSVVSRALHFCCPVLFVFCFALSAAAQIRPHGGMLRYPDVSRDKIAFVYANDIWVVSREGGMAAPLASPPGTELFPRFSPDGAHIAFVGNYDGNRDLYVVPVEGGPPKRITHHPDGETMCDWVPAAHAGLVAEGATGDRLLFYTNGLAGLRRQMQLFTVDAAGGLPVKLPVPYGATAAISADGEWLAYTPHTTDFRTWKRYRGGMATDIWLFNLKTKQSKQMTTWEGTDTQPMWQGQIVYYLSDAGPEHRQNIWSYDTTNGRTQQHTHYKDFDIKWASNGPGANGEGEIVFQVGAELRLFNLGAKSDKVVSVTIPGDRPKLRPRRVDVAGNMPALDISATGKRAVVEARGDIWTLPAEHGSPRNLTRSSGVFDRDPMWSPDGKWIAYFSDATGEYELYRRSADEKGEPEQLTRGSKTFYYTPTWSPDSKHIAFTDKAGNVLLCDVEKKETKVIDTDPWANAPRLSWSRDSGWIAYPKSGLNRQSAIYLYEMASGKVHQVTSGMFNDWAPTFDRAGDFLYFASNRAWSSPRYEDLGTTFVYNETALLYVVPLRKDVKLPFAPKSDEEPATTQPATSQPASSQATTSAAAESQPASAATSEPASQPGEKKDEKKPVIIELEDFERRAVQLEIKHGGFGNLAVAHDGKLIFSRLAGRGAETEPSIRIFDLADEKKEENTVLAGAAFFAISSDGKKLLVRKDNKMAIVDAAKDQKLDKTISTAGMGSMVSPREEWKQILTEVWRLQRDYFYDPHMHGVDWEAIYKQYATMLDDCASREDVGFVAAEMISELNAGHTYYGGGDLEGQPSVSVGMLGCDFELYTGPLPGAPAYRISKIYEGAPWDSDARGPLSQPGVDVKVGDYLLAVNRAPVDATRDPWASFQGLADQTVTLTVSDKPAMDDKARDVVVKLLSDESNLRYRAWIERNRAYVAEKTDGKVGYIYVPNTGVDGQNDLFRQFYGQVDKAALIIDERWNGGGQIPTRFIELLNRPITNYWARRDGHDWPWPPDSHQGPKCMLINGLAGSGGDAFPAYFRQSGLGKLIGMRTWGGLIGISGNPGLIDGAFTTVPTFGYYKKDGTWGIEGHGVDPDMEVVDDPAMMVDGGDPQLDAAIAHMLGELQRNPYRPPQRPKYPDRSGMGIREEDK